MKTAGSLSRNEDLVLAALREDGAPQTAYQLLDRLRCEGIKAPLQIYRALRSLSDRSLVHRLESLNAFVACAHDHAHGGHGVIFTICDTCGRVDEFTDEAVDRALAGLAGRESFRFAAAAVEMRGMCALCCDRASEKPLS